jgi:hypothetical protein
MADISAARLADIGPTIAALQEEFPPKKIRACEVEN